MTTDRINLAEELEAAEGGSRELDRLIAFLVGHKYGRIGEWANSDNGDYVVIDECAAHYTSSIDAAMALIREGWDFGCGSHDASGKAWAWTAEREDWRGEFWQTIQQCNAATPALALCAAALKAGE